MRPFVSLNYNFKFSYIKESIKYNEQWLFVYFKLFRAKQMESLIYFPQHMTVKIIRDDNNDYIICNRSSGENNLIFLALGSMCHSIVYC